MSLGVATLGDGIGRDPARYAASGPEHKGQGASEIKRDFAVISDPMSPL